MEAEKTPRERASEFIEDLMAPAWQLSRDQVMWAIRIVLVLTILLAILTLIGLPFGITLWAWLKLLIVPVVLDRRVPVHPFGEPSYTSGCGPSRARRSVASVSRQDRTTAAR
jgi:hypothetical protein